MSNDAWAERARAMEDAFFAHHDILLTRRLAELDDSVSKSTALSEASGLTDPAVVERLVGLGLSPANLMALTLVPLVAVAWADGKLDEPERAAVLASAVTNGLDPGHPGYAMLEAWLKTKPRPDLLAAWKAYAAALPADARADLKPVVIERTRAVAEASGGGILGLGRKISDAERAVLDDVTRALSS